MVGTCQTDRTGAGTLGKLAVKAKEIVIGSHECRLYQHNSKSLLYSVWGDNNFVKTLSNFHSPVITRGGMRRKRRDLQTNRREREQSDVDCSQQQKDYYMTYHLIDKGNGAEAKYDLSTESHLHGWPPKLAARYFNININRIPVMAPISAPILGSLFFGGIFPSKIGRFAPFLATIQALSKTRVFLYT
jgi:hypothetical protein